jgi:hypothetical protein
MGTNSINQELVSAYLDGVLNEAERAEAEALLAADQDARSLLDALTQQRSALAALPRRRLPATFAARVVAEAQLAAAQASRTPAAPDLAVQLPAAPPPKRLRHIGWAVAAAILACAAIPAVLWQIQPGEVELAVNPSEAISPEALDAIAQAPVAPTADSTWLTEPPAETALPPAGETMVRQENAGGAPHLRILLVMDVRVSLEAWQAGRFDALLDNAGIPLARPIAATDELEQALQSTRVTVGRVEQAEQSRAAFVFVQADAKSLDAVLSAVMLRTADFPEVALDVAFETPEYRLLQMLEKQADIVASQRAGATAAPLALAVVPAAEPLTDIASAAQFEPAPRRGLLISSSQRSRMEPSQLLAPAGVENAVSQVLFVLRKPE